MNVLYHLIIGAALLAASPYLLIRVALDRAFREDVSARLLSWRSLPRFSKTLWVHASSVGEVKVAKILIQKLKEKYPDRQVVLFKTRAGKRRVLNTPLRYNPTRRICTNA